MSSYQSLLNGKVGDCEQSTQTDVLETTAYLLNGNREPRFSYVSMETPEVFSPYSFFGHYLFRWNNEYIIKILS